MKCEYHRYINGKCTDCGKAKEAIVVGKKRDAGKPRLSLLHWPTIMQVVEVLEHGAAEYGDENWKHVDNHRIRYFNAACRHLILGWWMGEKLDKKSGKPHLAHAICCLIFLLARDNES